MKVRAEPLGVKVVVTDVEKINFATSDACGVLIQYPKILIILNNIIFDYFHVPRH